MKLADDGISRKADQEDFLEAGLSNVQKNQDFLFFYFFIYKAYLYGTVEEFVMFTLIYFNRSQHNLHLRGPLKFKAFKGLDIDCFLSGGHECIKLSSKIRC